MGRYHTDGASDEKPAIHRKQFTPTAPIDFSHPDKRSNQGRKHKDGISSNCVKGKHCNCFNLACPCDCHPRVK